MKKSIFFLEKSRNFGPPDPIFHEEIAIWKKCGLIQPPCPNNIFFSYTGKAPDAFFYVGTHGRPDGKNGTRIEYPIGTSEPLEAYSGLVWFLHHFNHYFGKFTLEEYCNHSSVVHGRTLVDLPPRLGIFFVSSLYFFSRNWRNLEASTQISSATQLLWVQLKIHVFEILSSKDCKQ